jgi:hypothetical protein
LGGLFVIGVDMLDVDLNVYCLSGWLRPKSGVGSVPWAVIGCADGSGVLGICIEGLYVGFDGK